MCGNGGHSWKDGCFLPFKCLFLKKNQVSWSLILPNSIYISILLILCPTVFYNLRFLSLFLFRLLFKSTSSVHSLTHPLTNFFSSIPTLQYFLKLRLSPSIYFLARPNPLTLCEAHILSHSFHNKLSFLFFLGFFLPFSLFSFFLSQFFISSSSLSHACLSENGGGLSRNKRIEFLRAKRKVMRVLSITLYSVIFPVTSRPKKFLRLFPRQKENH